MEATEKNLGPLSHLMTSDEFANIDNVSAVYTLSDQQRIHIHSTPTSSEANSSSYTAGMNDLPGLSNTCSLNPDARWPKFKERRRNLETMSLPECPLSGRNIQTNTPLTSRSFVFETPTASRRSTWDNKPPSQVSLQFTDPAEKLEKLDNPGQRRQRPSRFWSKEPPPKGLDIGQELDGNAPVWEKYCEEARLFDKSMTEGWNGDMDMLLVFVSLFT